ncbi:MAG: DNA replication/repair protein RecF [Lachnospiraceae bacterium]
MYIESIQLKSFRNYDILELTLDQGTNVFYGDNAQGKTNILESIYLCGTTKSHKKSKDGEVINFKSDESHLRMIVEKDSISYKIDMHLKKNRPKGIAINGLQIKKASELLGIVNIIFFSPEDLNIIKNGPSERRRFIDLELCQLNKLYLLELTKYNKIINQRNKLLRDIKFNEGLKDTLDMWDQQMIEYGSNVIKKRREFINELNEIIKEIHNSLTGNRENIEILYEANTTEEEFASVLRAGREKDIRMGMTMTGPHRDDLAVKVNETDIRKYGSQGQQRTAALSLKLSELAYVERKIKSTPILLLDDVLSELDSKRQQYLLNSIKNIQTLITCTGLSEIKESHFRIDRMFYVESGNVGQVDLDK